MSIFRCLPLIVRNYISNLMQPVTRDNFKRGGHWAKALSLILKVFGSPDISLRNIAHYIYRLNLVTITMSDDLFVHTVVALLAREIDSKTIPVSIQVTFPTSSFPIRCSARLECEV